MPPQTFQHGRGCETVAGGEAPQSADGFSVFGNVERRDSHNGYAVKGVVACNHYKRRAISIFNVYVAKTF
jgi:hypothetical protein